MDVDPEFLIIRKSEIESLVRMDDLLRVTASALAKTSNKVAVQDVRRVLDLPGAIGSCLSIMYAAIGDRPLFGAKVLSVMPDNFAHGLPSHRGVIVLFERAFGRPVGIVDGGEATAWRTAAASAIATKYLSRPESFALTLLGYGEQASRHVATIATVRPIRTIRVWGRDIAKAERFAAKQREAGFEAQAFADAKEAVAGADIVCTVTSSSQPILQGGWLAPGTHVNAIGASVPSCRELDAECVRRAGVWVDYMPMALTSAGELVEAIGSGLIEPGHIRGEIGAVVNGDLAGRGGDDEVTLYRSLGVPAQDIEIANFLYAAARAKKIGIRIQLEDCAHA